MPIVTVSHKAGATRRELDELRAELPEIVSRALACDEEPFDGELAPGDVNMKFLPVLDEGEGLDYVIEVTTKWTEARSRDLAERSAAIQSAVGALGVKRFGVWVELPTAAWSQDA